MDVYVVEGQYSDMSPYVEKFEHGLYSDNTSYVKSKYGRIGNTKMTILLRKPTDFHEAMMLGQYLKRSGPDNTVSLFMPYAVGARQDRSNQTGDILFAAKYYADIINSIGFDKVIILDPHSEVYPALLNNVRVVSAAKILDNENRSRKISGVYDGIIAPDAGASKRAYEVSRAFKIPLYQAFKHRSVEDGSLTGFAIQDIPKGHYLLVDDICDGGGTFNGLAEILPDGVTSDLYVTHGIFARGLRELRKNFGRIITTDSLPQYEIPDIVIDTREYINV